VQNTDFTPTILDIAGIEPPKKMQVDGLSLKSVFQGSKQPLRDHLFAELGYSRGVITKNWKYIAIRYDEAAQKQIAKNRPFVGQACTLA
jgi:arylsulfatase A-like enzyme